MNVLVTGANGQLGMELRSLAANAKDRYIFTCLHEAPGLETIPLDISNKDAVEITCDSEDVDIIVNCAAYNDVNRAEDDFQMADLINHTGAENLAAAAKRRNALLIHISTDYVFGGDSAIPYNEKDMPSPLGVYGATKVAGERGVMDSGCKYIIIRTSWMYSAYRKNFVSIMRGLLSERESVKVVCDQIGSPTYAGDLAGFIFWLISSRKYKGNYGLYHYSNEGTASWYDFAVAIGRLWNLPGKVLPCLSSEYRQRAERPHYSVLDKSLIKKTFGINIPHWTLSLEKFSNKQNGKDS